MEYGNSHDDTVAIGNGDERSHKCPKLNSAHISFTSISSNESGNNTSFDTVDAIPIRIQRMPLLSEDYIQKRQASVENLLSSRTPTQSLRFSRHGNLNCETDSQKENSKTSKENPDLYSYFEIQKNEYPNVFDVQPTSSTYVHKNSDAILRQRSVSDSDHSEHTSTFKAFDNGALHSLPKNIARRSVPKMSDQRDSGDVGEMHGYTETDLVAARQPKPILKDEPKEIEKEEEMQNPVNVGPVSTPPRNINNDRQVGPEQESTCSCGICMNVCCELVHWKHQCDRFSAWDIALTIGSIAIFIFDVVTDITLAVSYYRRIENDERYRFYAGLTFGLVIGPSVIIQAFSYFWVIDDFLNVQKRKKEISKKENVCKPVHVISLILVFIIHFFQLAVFFRYFRALAYGLKSRYYGCVKKEKYREHYDTLWRYEVHDINMLRLLESFLESAPQLVLQIYIMLMTKHVTTIVVVSCIGSLIALSTMMVAIQRAIRNSNEEKKQLSIPASIVMFCWRACTISSRVLAFGLFLTVRPLAFLVFIILHWLAATLWIAVRGTNFCTKKIAEYFFDGVCGLIYIFCFFNVHEEKDGRKSRSRWRMLVFYTVVLAENCVLSILWYYFRPVGDMEFTSTNVLNSGGILSSTTKQTVIEPPDLIPTKSAGVIQSGPALAMLFAVVGFYIIGLVFMLIYYATLHPKKSSAACCCLSQNRKSGENSATTLVSAPAERFTRNSSYALVPGDESGPRSAGAVLMSPISSQPPNNPNTQEPRSYNWQRSVEVRETSPRRSAPESESSDTEKPSQALWSATVFNRGKRAKKLYTRQYSREKALDVNEDVAQSHELISRYSPRRTERYKTVVTPTRETKNIAKSPIRWIDPAKSKTSKSSVGLEKTQPSKASIVPKPDDPYKPTLQSGVTEASISKSSAILESENSSAQSGNIKETLPKTNVVKNPVLKTSSSVCVKERRPTASVVIKPGSQTLKPVLAPRSATHHELRSHTLLSPKKNTLNPSMSLHSSPTKHSNKFPSKKVPQPVEGRDYSASMSCLMGDKPLSYAARRRQALNCDVPRASSFTIKPSEVIECMESSV